MIEDALWESLSTGVGPKVSSETERLVYRQISLYDEHRRTDDLLLLEHVTTSAIEYTVNSTNSHLRTLDLAEIDGLHESGRGSEQTRVETTSRRWDDLAATSVNCVGVQRHVINVETYTSQVLFRKYTL